MKKEIKGFICGVVVTSLIGCMSISAAGVWDKIDVLRNDINIVVNGIPVKTDNFLYNDTTYLPMRAVAEALGKDVQYDETTNTATIKDKGDNNLSENTEANNTTNTNQPQGKYTPNKSIRSMAIIIPFNNIYYIDAASVYNFADSCGVTSNIYEVVEDKNETNLILGDRTWKMERVELLRSIPFDTFIDEILPYLGIDPTPYIN